jgi:hypothetical protein
VCLLTGHREVHCVLRSSSNVKQSLRSDNTVREIGYRRRQPFGVHWTATMIYKRVYIVDFWWMPVAVMTLLRMEITLCVVVSRITVVSFESLLPTGRAVDGLDIKTTCAEYLARVDGSKLGSMNCSARLKHSDHVTDIL